MPSLNRLFLVRHGQTAWSLSGQHTGKTDIPLTEQGKKEALALKSLLRNTSFTKAFVSPLKRAQETFFSLELNHVPFHLDPRLLEWDYGEYEGLTSDAILEKNPGWNVFDTGAPGGESPAQLEERATHLLREISSLSGDVLLVSSAHILRVIAACWLKQPIQLGKHLQLGSGSLSILSYEREIPSLFTWNQRPLEQR